MCPNFDNDIEEMSNVHCASLIGSLMYEMVSTRLYIAQATGVLRRFMSQRCLGTCELLLIAIWFIMVLMMWKSHWSYKVLSMLTWIVDGPLVAMFLLCLAIQ